MAALQDSEAAACVIHTATLSPPMVRTAGPVDPVGSVVPVALVVLVVLELHHLFIAAVEAATLQEERPGAASHLVVALVCAVLPLPAGMATGGEAWAHRREVGHL